MSITFNNGSSTTLDVPIKIVAVVLAVAALLNVSAVGDSAA